MLQFPFAAWVIAALHLPVAPVPALPALRWGPLGHHIVAEIAQARLTPAAAAEVRRLLGGSALPDVASWADEHRADLGPSYSPWHYVDIEIGDTSYEPSRDCKQNACVIAAVTSQIAVLKDRSATDSARAFALKWVVHLIGDLHQPLHGGERGDKGGNDVKLTFQGHQTNLHSLWDTGLLTSFGQSDEQIVQQLTGEIDRRKDISALTDGAVVKWVMESHDLARDVVYRNLPNSLEITPAYVDAARPVIYERLLRAGVRLAAILNQTLTH